MRLTDISIRALKAPESGAVIHYDDTLPGFGVRVSEGGTKSYVLTHGARRTRETIGRVTILGLADARTAAKVILAQYTLGKSQVVSRPWDKALDEYLEHVRQENRPSTYKSYKRHLKKHFRFGRTHMDKIPPHDFQKALDRLSDRKAELHHAFVYLRAFVRWAYRKHYLHKNPIERMETPPPSKSKDRILDDKELVKVWNAAPDDAFGRVVKLLILCGQRPGETSKIDPKTMVKGDLITLPDSLTKNKLQHTFPFPRMAKPYLHHLSYAGFSKAKARLDAACGVENWTLHDLRRTLRSNWARLGISREVAEKYINHISGTHSGMDRIYNRYDYLPEMRAAVAKYESWLTGEVKIG